MSERERESVTERERERERERWREVSRRGDIGTVIETVELRGLCEFPR